MKTIPDIIEEMGGATELSRLLGISAQTTVASWKARQSIPVEHWKKLIEAAKAKNINDISIDSLILLHTAEKVA